jgi:hypothetical protein
VSFLIFKALGADLTKGFGYFDLDLVLSHHLLNRIALSSEKKVYLTGYDLYDFGHFRYYKIPFTDIYNNFGDLPVTCESIFSSEYSFALDESVMIRRINSKFTCEIVKGFDQDIYSYALKNYHTGIKSLEINYDGNVWVDNVYFDYLHIQKRGYWASLSFRVLPLMSNYKHFMHLLVMIRKRVMSKIFHERKIKGWH